MLVDRSDERVICIVRIRKLNSRSFYVCPKRVSVKDHINAPAQTTIVEDRAHAGLSAVPGPCQLVVVDEVLYPCPCCQLDTITIEYRWVVFVVASGIRSVPD